ncbi:pyrimidine/purine nucleoside phosphorylase [Desulfopila sp. IMCC35006]|uniref:pyrimidine/purine nucleoside phosphorylase n=1 Tax=Desulfopila sp. IMCC35006 TaxID=2569542 RepID=UPI0010AB652F|nr:pyrimidine/purine nucleoside phosphorylase [Desulfopila sp. IMCC35006]TKB23285.1 pyrimidine/purine nucleoside phosphorylase [Desulfopila sp. IMCC35006]
MSEFKNVTAIREANIYFDGKVTSRTLVFADGSRKTLGIMFPGKYEFSTADREIMEILSGELEVLLSADDGWKTIQGGEQFDVPAETTFNLNVKSLTDYCCSYIK